MWIKAFDSGYGRYNCLSFYSHDSSSYLPPSLMLARISVRPHGVPPSPRSPQTQSRGPANRSRIPPSPGIYRGRGGRWHQVVWEIARHSRDAHKPDITWSMPFFSYVLDDGDDGPVKSHVKIHIANADTPHLSVWEKRWGCIKVFPTDGKPYITAAEVLLAINRYFLKPLTAKECKHLRLRHTATRRSRRFVLDKTTCLTGLIQLLDTPQAGVFSMCVEDPNVWDQRTWTDQRAWTNPKRCLVRCSESTDIADIESPLVI
ncbi:hypothetical protein C8J57DRAFT_1327064 [Mycena rebaudengoi]|nr:hypothetical protein C8J57DRAFT_1327064 [Mycena rebaudengoi]